MHLINNVERKKKSTGATKGICGAKRMKCCRPNVNELIHNLKRSLLWFEGDDEPMWYLSQKLIDDNIMEW